MNLKVHVLSPYYVTDKLMGFNRCSSSYADKWNSEANFWVHRVCWFGWKHFGEKKDEPNTTSKSQYFAWFAWNSSTHGHVYLQSLFSGSSVTWYFILSSKYSLKFLKEWLDIIFMQMCEKWKLWWSSWLGSICCKAYYNASKVSFFHDSLSSMQPYFICKPALLRHCFLFLFQKEFLWFRL